MPIEIRKKEGENQNAFLFRFNKKVKQSGVLKEAKKRRFKSRAVNKRKKKLGALYKIAKQEELAKLKKYGFASSGKDR